MLPLVTPRVASIVVLVAASLATPIAAYAADSAAAAGAAPSHHVREVGGAAKKHAAAERGVRGRHAQHDKDKKKHEAAAAAAPAKHPAAPHPARGAVLPPAVVIGAPAPAAAPPPPPVRGHHAAHGAVPAAGASAAAGAGAHGCQKHAVTVIAGDDDASFALTGCDGKPAPGAAERLSVLARPGGVAEPSASVSAMAHKKGSMIAPGIRRVSTGLVERLQKIADHFARPGKSTRIVVVSGYRPQSGASYHATARALDFRVEGVADDALIAFCKTLDDTGCGYYPNADFIHMDVRDSGTGHVAWIDASGAENNGAPEHHPAAVARNTEADIDPPAVLAAPETPQTWQP